MAPPPPPSSRTVWALALEADTDPATVRRRLAGHPLDPSTAARVERAAAKLGVVLPPRVADARPGSPSPDDAA